MSEVIGSLKMFARKGRGEEGGGKAELEGEVCLEMRGLPYFIEIVLEISYDAA